ncbi:MAG: acireductone synthase [Cyanobacteriota bacterium]|nr:acireductone synthase [Cyanobacteriota bacterium]
MNATRRRPDTEPETTMSRAAIAPQTSSAPAAAGWIPRSPRKSPGEQHQDFRITAAIPARGSSTTRPEKRAHRATSGAHISPADPDGAHSSSATEATGTAFTADALFACGHEQQQSEAMQPPPPAVSWVLLDIEGTTCPVTFVSETLFPYASRNLENLIASCGDDLSVQALLHEVEEAWSSDPDPQAIELRIQSANSPPQLSCLAYLRWLIEKDRKLPALKELQGMVWERGYASGDLQAPLFADVPPALLRWQAAGISLAVYSSGSIAAQKLLYAHTAAGDLRACFRCWFDTRTGSKREASSYRTIATQLACEPGSIQFISDIKAELDAAHAAGMQVLFSQREGNPEQDPGPYPVIRTFSAWGQGHPGTTPSAPA